MQRLMASFPSNAWVSFQDETMTEAPRSQTDEQSRWLEGERRKTRSTLKSISVTAAPRSVPSLRPPFIHAAPTPSFFARPLIAPLHSTWFSALSTPRSAPIIKFRIYRTIRGQWMVNSNSQQTTTVISFSRDRQQFGLFNKRINTKHSKLPRCKS